MNKLLRFLHLGAIVAPLPVTLVNGTIADATDVMTDLNWIKDQVNANATAGTGTITRNILINGSMEVSQRYVATTATLAGVKGYTLDRWQGSSGAASSGAFAQVTSLGLSQFQYAARVQRTAANVATTAIQLAQSLESLDSYQMQGQTVTLSFWARAGANFSPASNAVVATVYTGTGTDENVLLGYTGSAASVTKTFNITNSWAKYQVSGSIPTTATEVGVVFTVTPTGTAGAADYFDVTGVQLEISPSASNFDFRPAQENLARCQRYYQKSFDPTVVPQTGQLTGRVFAAANKAGAIINWFSVPSLGSMRATANGTIYNPVSANNQMRNETAAADFTSCSGTAWASYFLAAGTAPVATAAGDICTFHWTADAEL